MAALTKPLLLSSARRFASTSDRSSARCCQPLRRSPASALDGFGVRLGATFAIATFLSRRSLHVLVQRETTLVVTSRTVPRPQQRPTVAPSTCAVRRALRSLRRH